MADAMKKHKDADVMISFASLRSAYESTLETMEYPQVSDLFFPLELSCCKPLKKNAFDET